ncbi:dimethylsulfonioproprionate lyase family protein [Tabrizicola sp. YIM 78059]|uniref:dimethylsulfonioproprionate lyase family protein n=1 Tax=Tabrizicola sp. YIM 78059 TaxID=2529861 RepID=UPI0010AA37FF|nr:dimethylsulfonioproprionate lyase family protein [Tabrizicola sp. YIM 78059]
MDRPPDIAAFLDSSARALRAACSGQALRAAEKVIARAAMPGRPGDGAARLPVCDWIATALAGAPAGRADLAGAFAALEGRLRWYRRGSASESEPAFWNGHANAVILGPGGLETRDDLWIGATVMAPNVNYMDHDHPPEEVYLSLTPGEWWNSAMDWTDPGPDGFIYNPPGITHAMRSGTGPFLALWYLPL